MINDWSEDHEDLRECKDSGWADIVWVRADEVDELRDNNEGRMELYKEGIEPNDV